MVEELIVFLNFDAVRIARVKKLKIAREYYFDHSLINFI
jgi:hypothetical protein